MSQRGDQRPSAKNILVDEFLSPEQIKKMHENQVRLRGKVSSLSPSLEKPSSREFVIETDSKEISRVSILTHREETVSATGQAALRLERCLRLKLTKIKFHALTKLVGSTRHYNQKKFASRMLVIIAEWKRKQHVLRAFRYLCSYGKAKGKVPNITRLLFRLINRVRSRKIADAFKLLANFRSNEKSAGQLEHQSQHTSHQGSQQASQISLQLNLDPNKNKSASSSSRFARKPSRPENLTDRPTGPANNEQVIRDYEQLMSMSLSNEAREALIKMQRFDRFIYAQESEKTLKGPIQVELRRLERIKNGDKALRNIYFDTELSITVLFNHIKTVFELNRQLKEMEALKEQNKALEARIIEINVQKAKDIKEITATLKKPADENTRLKGLEGELKEHKKLNQLLYTTIREGALDKTRKLLEVQLRKHQNETGKELSIDRREMLEIIQQLVNSLRDKPEAKVEQEGPVNISELRNDLKGLFEAQTALEKNITYLEKQKRIYEAKEAESRTAEGRELYSVLGLGAAHVSSLYTEIKAKNAQISELSRKLQEIDKERQRSDRLKSDSEEKGLLSMNKLRSELDNERSKSKDLEKKLGELNRSMKTEKDKELKEKEFKDKEENDGPLREWQAQLGSMIAKIEKEERTWYGDVQRQRKLINTKRTTDRYSNLISQNVSLLETIIKRERTLEQLSTEITQLRQVNPANESKRQETEERLNKEREKVKELTDERNALKKQLQDLARVDKPEKKDLLGNELAELQKAIANIEQAFTKQAESETQYPLDWVRIKKMIDRRKFNSLLPLIGFIETLMRMLTEWEDAERRRQNELNKSESVKQRQMNSLAALNKTIDRVLDEKNIKFEEVTFNRLRKILENNINKYDKMAESGEAGWCGMLKEAAISKQKMLKLFEEDRRALSAEIEQLQGYVSQLQTQLKSDKQQFDRYQSETNPKLASLEHSLKSVQEQFERTHKEESEMILKLEQERGHLITKLDKKEHDVKRLEDKVRTLEAKQSEHLKEIKQFKEAIEMYSKEERAMLNAIELTENENRSLMTQLQILSSGSGEQEKQRAKAEQDRSELARVHQKLSHLQKELEIKDKTMKQNEEAHNRTIDEFQQELKNVEGNLNRLLQVNSTLEAEKQELEKAANRSMRESHDEDGLLASENVKLYNEVAKMQQKLAEVEDSCKLIEVQNIHLREEINQRQEQQLNLMNKLNKLEKEVADFRSENDMLVLNADQYEHQMKDLRERLLETERFNREGVEASRLKEETYKATIFELRSEIQRLPSLLLLEELKLDFKRKEEGYLKLIEEIRLSFSKDTGNEQESLRFRAELERNNIEANRMRAELKSQEEYIRQLSDQHEATIQRRTQSYENQIELMRRELDQLAVTHPEAMRRLDNEHRQRESELQRVHEEALSKFYNKEREMQSELSSLRAELMRLNIPTAATSTLEIELKRQEEHYERVLAESAATSHSQIRLLESESARLKNEIVRLQRQAREREEYYARLIQSNEQLFASREKVSETSTANIKLEISRQARDSGLERQLQIELKRQEQHYLKLIEQNAAIFESKEKSFETEILNLHQQITKLTRETVQHSIVQNLEMELRRQQDHYIKLIEQNNIIFESKEKSFETEISQLRNELARYQLNFRTLEDNHLRATEQNQALASSKEKLLEGEISRLRVELIKMETDVKIPAEGIQQELKKQKEYYSTLIEQNTRSYEQQRNEMEAELGRLKAELQRQSREVSNAGVIANLQQELRRQEEHYLLLLSQNNAILESKERSFQAQIQQMRIQLMRTEGALQSQEDSYKKVIAQSTTSSNQKTSALEAEVAALRENLRSLEANPPLNQNLLNEELRRQKEYFLELIDQNANKFAAEESKFRSEVRSLSGANSSLTQELTRLKYESARIPQLAEQNSSMQMEIDRMARELDNSKAALKTETERLAKEALAARTIAQADVDRLTRELQNARNSHQTTSSEELKKKDEYYLKLIDQNRIAADAKIRDLEAAAGKLREELAASHTSARDLIRPEVLHTELRNMEAHFSKMLDENVAIFQNEEAKLNAQINDLRAELSRAQGEGNQQTQSARKLSGELQQQSDQVRRLTTDSQTKDEQLKRLNAELESAKKAVAEAQLKDEQIRRLSAQLQQKEEALKRTSAELNQAKSTTGGIQQKDELIRNLNLQVQQNIEQTRVLKIELQQKEEHFKGLIIELQQRDQHIRGLIFQHQQKDEHMKRMGTDMQHKDEQIRRAISNRQETEQKVRRLTQDLKLKEEHVVRVAAELNSKEQQIRRLSQQQAAQSTTQTANNSLLLKEKTYQSEIASLMQRESGFVEEINKLKQIVEENQRTMLPIIHFEQELQKQQQHFTQLLDMNANTYMQQERKFELEIESLKRGIAEGAGKQAIENELKLANERHLANEAIWHSETQQLKLAISSLQTEAAVFRKIEAESKELRANLIRTQADRGRLEAENTGLKQALQATQQLRTTVANLQSEVRTVQNEKQQLVNTINQLEAELGNLSAAHGESQHLKASLSTLQSEIGVLRASQAESLQLRSKLGSVQAELTQSRTLMTDNQQLRNSLAGLQAELTALKALQNEYTLLRSFASTLQVQNATLKGIQGEAQQLRATLISAQNELNNLRAAQLEAQQLRLRFSGLEYELAQNRNIEADNQQLRNTLLALQNDLNNLRNAQLEAQELKVRMNGIESDLLQARKENQELKSTTQTLSSELRTKENSESAANAQLSSLQTELGRLRLENQRMKQESDERKQNLTPQLMEAELRKQEQHFLGLLDENAAIFQGKQKDLQAEASRLRTELRRQEENFMKLLDENAHRFQTKEREFDAHTAQLRQEVDRLRDTSFSASVSTKEVESLRSQLASQEQLYKSQLQTQEQLFKTQLQSLEQQSKSQLLIFEQQNKKFLSDAAGSNSQFEQEINRLRADLIQVQKDRDARIQENLERMKFYEHHSDKLTKSVAELEARLNEAKSDNFKLREANHTLDLNKIRLEDQLKTSSGTNKVAEDSKFTVLVEERYRLQVDVDRFRLKSEEEQQIRRDLEEKYSNAMHEKTGLLERIDKLQSLVYEKEMELVKSLQKREENIQELMAENKSLQSELKKIQEKLIAYEFKSVLSPANQIPEPSRAQQGAHETELQLLREENTFVKERIRFLEIQLRDANRQHEEVRPEPAASDKYLLKMEGERLKQNLHEVEQTNMDLYNRINALTRGEGERDDFLEIGILRKINDEVTELIDNNKLLMSQVHYLEVENRTLNQTLAAVRNNTGAGGPLSSGEEMAAELTRVLDNVADLLNEQSMPEELCDKYDHYLERLEGCLEKRNLSRYVEIFEEFIRTIFISLIEAKDHMLQKQAATLLELREKMGDLIDQQIEESEYSERMSPQPIHGHSMYEDRHAGNGNRRHEQHSLQYLWKHYVKYRRPDTFEEIGRLLHAEEEE